MFWASDFIWGNVVIYIREDISSKELTFFNMPENVESIFVEINLFNAKWPVCVDVITHQVKMISTFSII